MKQLEFQPNLKEMLIRAACYRPLSRLEETKAARIRRRASVELFQFRFLQSRMGAEFTQSRNIWLFWQCSPPKKSKKNQKRKSTFYVRIKPFNQSIRQRKSGENGTFMVRWYFNPSTQNGPPPCEPETAPLTNHGCGGSFFETDLRTR